MLALRLLITSAIFLLPLLISGRLNWWPGWIAPALIFVFLPVNYVLIRRYNPAVFEARSRNNMPKMKFDKIFSLITVLLTVALIAGASIGARSNSSPLPPWAIITGALLQVAAYIPISWSMLANPFLETSVRIQTDRGHRVIETGPYRLVRHPMYTGMVLMNCGLGLGYGSIASLIPALLIAAAFVYRTMREDETLRRELPGYEEFASRTRFRLVPGLW